MSNVMFADKAAFLRSVRELGKKAGEGELTGGTLLVNTSIASAEGRIADTVEDAKEVWGDYRDTKAKKLVGAAYDPTDDVKKQKTKVSVVRKVILAGKLNENFGAFVSAAMPDIAAGITSGIYAKKNMFNPIYDLARMQEKVAKEEKANLGECRNLNDDEMMEALGVKEKEEKASKSDIELLEKLLATITKTGEAMQEAPPVLESIAEQLRGAIGSMTFAADKAAAAQELAAAMAKMSAYSLA